MVLANLLPPAPIGGPCPGSGNGGRRVDCPQPTVSADEFLPPQELSLTSQSPPNVILTPVQLG